MRMRADDVSGPSSESVEAAIGRAEALLRPHVAKGRPVFVWRNPTPMFLTGAHGSGKGLCWQWAIRVGLSMDGWCAGFARHLTVPLPFHGDLPGSPWKPPAQVFEAIERLIAAMGTDHLTVIEPTTAASSPATAGNQPCDRQQSRAASYNKSPGRAVRLRRAAHSAMRNGYF